ncbi:hypothetical protein GCM10018962_24090 [Dactylosporangium matsuzakiense]|uniref:DUF4209 domain-containing protein n=2 Tax=Dactylosporangium matsuzakiense TaxID=53360 RepID=A0A9W6KUL0_9ACTN|nr:DUF4209 domain-containing protein [Dactylosporangium matsuzakiense]GLL07485.1 hypothetical protein GCM10017581_092370 [Dactylosporangium matsuzakiense]
MAMNYGNLAPLAATTSDDSQDETVQPDADAAGEAIRGPYEFDAAHVSVAVSMVDDAFATAVDSFDAGLSIMKAAIPAGTVRAASLRAVLVDALTNSLRLAPGGEKAGCFLDPADGGGGSGGLAAIRETPDDVVRLWRGIAASVSAAGAVAHFEDLLFCRHDGNGRARATRSGEAYLTAVHGRAVDIPVVEMLIRAWTLARNVRNSGLDADARSAMFTAVSDVMAARPGERPGVVLPMLAALAAGPLEVKGTPTVDPLDVDGLLRQAAEDCHDGRHASEIARLRRPRTSDPVAREAIAREEVAACFRSADAAPQAAVRMIRLEEAAQIAKKRSLPDLERVAAAGMQAIKPADLGFQVVSASEPLPTHVAEGFLHPYTRSPDWRDGLDFFLASDPPSGDIDDLRSHARQARSGLSLILPPLLFAGGLPRMRAATAADQEKHEMSFFAGVRAENIARLTAEGLDRLAAHYGIPSEDDLVDFFMSRGSRDPRAARTLAKAFRHFWHGDYESSIHLAAPAFEGAARNLLIELDEGIYRAQADKEPGGYPGLYTLISELEKLALDESWAYFFRWLLGGPYGANIRNTIAHGLPSEMSPAVAVLTLRAVSVLAVVVGATSTRVHTSNNITRDRETVLNMLASPTPLSGKSDRLLGWVADRLGRAAWTVDLLRIRLARRRTPKNHT